LEAYHLKVSEKQTLKRKKIAIAISSAIKQSNHSKLTVDEMCNAADIAKGTFYHYFSSKEDLLSEVLYTTPIDDLFSIVEKDIVESSGFIEAILSYTRTYSEHILSSGLDVCHTVLQEMVSPENSRFRSYERHTVKLLYDTIKYWQDKGAVTKKLSTKQLCDMFIVAIRGYLLNWYTASEKYDLTEAMTSHAQIFASSMLVK
jgi:AcrR family transcriptional regulator